MGKRGWNRHPAWRYLHEFSGGQRQRVGIARALAAEPHILLLGEPVSSLDVSGRARVLNLLVSLRQCRGLSYLYISHDLGSVRFISHPVAVMYHGRIVALADVEAIRRLLHPHTNATRRAIPVPDPDAAAGEAVLCGEVPSAWSCRAAAVSGRARRDETLRRTGADVARCRGGHLVACHRLRQ